MKRLLLPIALILLLLQSCGDNSKQKAPVREKLKLTSDIQTPEVLWSMGRIGEFSVSPDAQNVVYNVSDYYVDENKSFSRIYIMDIDGKNVKCLTQGDFSEYSPVFTPNGTIAYMTAASGDMQLWEMNINGKERKQITDIQDGITGFKYSNDGQRIVYSAEVKMKETVADIYPDLPLSSGRINNDLMYRHWDQWVDTFSHLFVAKIGEGMVTGGEDILDGEPWESPVRPLGRHGTGSLDRRRQRNPILLPQKRRQRLRNVNKHRHIQIQHRCRPDSQHHRGHDGLRPQPLSGSDRQHDGLGENGTRRL